MANSIELYNLIDKPDSFKGDPQLENPMLWLRNMEKLPQELKNEIITFCDSYIKLALGVELDNTQLFREGGPGMLLTKIIARGGDIKMLFWVKNVGLDMSMVLKKCIDMKNENALRNVLRIYDNKGFLRYATNEKFIPGMLNLDGNEDDKLYAKHMYNNICKSMPILDIPNPLCKVDNPGMLVRYYRDTNTRKHLGSWQLAKYKGYIGDLRGVPWSMTKGVAIGMISGLIEGKHMNKALMIYNRMKREGIDFIDTLIPYKLQQWEDTWAPTLSKAIYNKDYKIVNEELYVDPLDDKVKILVMLDPIPDVGWIHRDGMLEMDEHGEWKQVFQPWEEIDIHPGTSLTEFEHGIEYRIHDDKTTINIIKLYLDNPSMFMIEIDNYNTILRRGDEYGYLCNACMENIDNTNCTCTNMYKISICKHDIGNFGMAFRYYLGW